MRNFFTSFEIYDLGKSLGVPVSRSVLHWFRKEKLFVPSGTFYNHFIYSSDDVIQILLRLADKRGIDLVPATIEKEMERMSQENKVLKAF